MRKWDLDQEDIKLYLGDPKKGRRDRAVAIIRKVKTSDSFRFHFSGGVDLVVRRVLFVAFNEVRFNNKQ